MKRILTALFSLFIFACDNGTDSNSQSINPGLYEFQTLVTYQGETGKLIMQFRANANGTYEDVMADETGEFEQTKGKYRLSGDSLFKTEKLTRELLDNGQWSAWKSEENSSHKIRNVTSTSFQVLPSFDNDADKEAASAMGFPTSWFTFNRIGN